MVVVTALVVHVIQLLHAHTFPIDCKIVEGEAETILLKTLFPHNT